MSDQGRLLGEFDVPSLEQWTAEVERLLKGAPFARKMFTTTVEGIEVGSMATAADRPDSDWMDTQPGQVPYLRGTGAAAGWLVAQEIPCASAAAFNTALLQDLERGQDAVNLILEGAGSGGTAINGPDDLGVALRDVDLASTPVLIQAGERALATAKDFLKLAADAGVNAEVLRGRLGCDPVAGLASSGTLPVPASQLFDDLAALVKLAPGGLKTLPVYEDPWHDGGADGALGLGLVLASALNVLREMESRGLSLEEAASRVHFNLCIGSDFFLEISRLRALRVLWTRVLTACGVDPATAPLTVHARTSRRTGTRLDPHVNMLRATTQAMSAVLGGVDSLHVAPFDETTSRPDAFSRRIARNVQLILAHECHFDHVADPAGGSWFVEKLTAEVAAAAWVHFQDVENAGGMLVALEGGMVQARVAAAAKTRAARLATRRDVLVGTNQYPDPNSLTDAGEGEADGVEGAIPLRRDGVAFEELRGRVEAMGATDPAAGRVFCVCLGDVSRYMPRLEFTRRFYRVGGFTVTDSGFAATAGHAVAAARADGARTVVLVGLDKTYAELAAPVVEGLQKDPDPPVVMLAGAPVEGVAVAETINIKSNVLDVLARLADTVGGES